MEKEVQKLIQVNDWGEVGEQLNEIEKKLSKGQLKKRRLNRIKEEEAVKALHPLEKKEEKEKKEEPKVKSKKEGKSNPAAECARKQQEKQQKFQAEQERRRLQFEREQKNIHFEEEEKKKSLFKQLQQKRIQEARAEIRHLKKLGIQGKGEKNQQNQKRKRKQFLKNHQTQVAKEEKVQEQSLEPEVINNMIGKKKKREEYYMLKDDKLYFASKEGEFRSPVCCILGHVDTGKTTLLDKIRSTNVLRGDTGGITQQIGATFFPQDKLQSQINKCKSFYPVELNVPGLLIIDTPGHESFSYLRQIGSSLCDIAILVIDIRHGLENQTLESLELLSKKNTPFVVALNKIDHSYRWRATQDQSSKLTLKNQSQQSIDDYENKLHKIILQLNTKGYNAALYWENNNPIDYISLVPTSGVTGEGIPDLLSVIVKYSLTFERITKRIRVKEGKFLCTVIKANIIEGYETTIDCILVDGCIKNDDQIVVLGFQGPILTKVKAILTPRPMKEMCVRDEYLHHREIWGANGVKIVATGLDNAMAGTPLIVVHNEEEIQAAKAFFMNEQVNLKKKIKLQNLGVGVAASSLGSLETLLEYLNKQNVPVSYVSVGPVSREDIMKSMKSVLTEIPEHRKKEYACFLVFDVKVLPDAQKYAEDNEIKIFTANIIYHLTDFYIKYVKEVREELKAKYGKEAVFPCVLKQVTTFRKNDPIIVGVDVKSGVIRIGTPLVVFREGERGDKQIRLGYVESIEHNHKQLKEARKTTGSVVISIGGDPSISSGKQFTDKDRLVSQISRRSIDCLKENYRSEVTNEDWQLVMELKKYFHI